MLNFRLIAFILAASLFSAFIYPGYSVFETGDSRIYITDMFLTKNQPEYSDKFLAGKPTNFTLFDELVFFLADAFNSDVFAIIFFLAIITRAIFYYAVHRIAFYFTNDAGFSMLAVALLFFAPPFIENFLVPRTISFALGTLSLHLLFEKKNTASVVSVTMAVLAQAAIALPFFIFYLLDFYFIQGKKILSRESLINGSVFLTGAALILSAAHGGISIFSVFDASWTGIQYGLTYVSAQGIGGAIKILLSLGFIYLGAMEIRKKTLAKEKKSRLKACVAIPIGLLLASFVFVDVFQSVFAAKWELVRMISILKILGLLAIGYFGYEQIKKEPRDVLYNFSIIGTIVFYFGPGTFFASFYFFVFLAMFWSQWLAKNTDFFKTAVMKNLFTGLLTLSVFLYTTLASFGGYLRDFMMAHTFTNQAEIVYNFRVFVAAFELDLFLFLLAVTVFATLLAGKTQFVLRDFSVNRLVAAMFAIAFVGIVVHANSVIYPEYYGDKEYTQACRWILDNTEPDAKFITTPFSSENDFIVSCQRHVFFPLSMFVYGFYDRDYQKKYEEIIGILRSDDINSLGYINEKYGATHVLSEGPIKQLSERQVFGNGKYFAYELEE